MRKVLFLMTSILVLAVSSCAKKSQSAQATADQLQKSYQKADPSVAAEIAEAGNAVRAANFTQAALIMNRVAQTQPIDEARKKAVDSLIIQARKAAEQNPKLNTPELYKALSDLTMKVHGEN